MTRPDLKNLSVSICGDAAYVFCSRCNEKQMVAFGKSAASISRLSILKALKLLGWASAPMFLCVNCKVAEENRPPTGEDIIGWNA